MNEQAEYFDLTDNPTVDSLTKLIGDELLEKLSADLGGKRVHIPRTPTPNSPIAFSIGLDAATKISKAYGGMTADIPLRQGTRLQVRQLRAENKSANEIAHQLKITRARVFQLLAEDDKKKQGDLFTSK